MEVGSVDVYFPRVGLAIFNRDELELRRCQRRRVAIGRFGLRAASLELGHAHLHIGAEACLIVALRWRLCDRGLSGQDKPRRKGATRPPGGFNKFAIARSDVTHRPCPVELKPWLEWLAAVARRRASSRFQNPRLGQT